MGEIFHHRKPVRRRVRKVRGKDFHKEFESKVQQPTSDALWCSSCRKHRVWKDIIFQHYLYKGAWWRKKVCKMCGDVLVDEALE